jgi:protein-arginine kinase activator protein McsA
MSADQVLFSYVVLLLGALAGLAIYSELRQRRFRPEKTEDRVFRCEKCNFVYTDDEDVDRSRCSQCGQINDAIEF